MKTIVKDLKNKTIEDLLDANFLKEADVKDFNSLKGTLYFLKHVYSQTIEREDKDAERLNAFQETVKEMTLPCFKKRMNVADYMPDFFEASWYKLTNDSDISMIVLEDMQLSKYRFSAGTNNDSSGYLKYDSFIGKSILDESVFAEAILGSSDNDWKNATADEYETVDKVLGDILNDIGILRLIYQDKLTPISKLVYQGELSKEREKEWIRDHLYGKTVENAFYDLTKRISEVEERRFKLFTYRAQGRCGIFSSA